MNELLQDALANKETIILGLSGVVAGLIVLAKLTPTEKDDKALGFIAKILAKLKPAPKKDD